MKIIWIYYALRMRLFVHTIELLNVLFWRLIWLIYSIRTRINNTSSFSLSNIQATHRYEGIWSLTYVFFYSGNFRRWKNLISFVVSFAKKNSSSLLISVSVIIWNWIFVVTSPTWKKTIKLGIEYWIWMMSPFFLAIVWINFDLSTAWQKMTKIRVFFESQISLCFTFLV